MSRKALRYGKATRAYTINLSSVGQGGMEEWNRRGIELPCASVSPSVKWKKQWYFLPSVVVMIK